MYISMCHEELVQHYHNRGALKAAEESTNKLESLKADYDALLQRLKKDPNMVDRIGPATLGTEPADANAVYPKATVEQLAAARKAAAKDSNQQLMEPVVPDWLRRCGEPRRRIILFLSGAFLILISFVCFGPAKRKSR